HVVVLLAGDVGGTQLAGQERILTEGLERAPPAGVADEVDRRPEVDVCALAEDLRTDHVAVPLLQPGVEGGRGGDSCRQLGDSTEAGTNTTRTVHQVQLGNAQAGVPGDD